jgi:C_GCAxxG_C_C family probable redox protein
VSDRDLSARAEDLFLTDNTYGCAEVALITLQEHFGLPDAMDSSPAMALNGGVAYSGGTCGAITGAALALGRAVAASEADHSSAKRTARSLVRQLMAEFDDEFGSTRCRDLTGFDLLRDHDAFIAEGTWRDTCTRQIQFAVEQAASLTSTIPVEPPAHGP